MSRIFPNPINYKQLQQIQSFYEPALKILSELIERNKSNLKQRGYNEKNAAITRYEFQENLQRRFRININLATEICLSLYKSDRIQMFGGYVKPKLNEENHS